MSAEQFQEANTLIKNRQFEAARALLKTIDHPRAAEWLRKLDEIAPPLPAPIPNAMAAFECTKCFREVGPAMKVCDYRDHGACSFQYVQEPLGQSFVGLSALMMGLLVALGGVCMWSVNADADTRGFAGVCCFGPAIGFFIFGLYKFAGLRTTVIDRNTGIMWQKDNLLGIPMGSDMVTESEIVPLPVPPNFPLKYPPSISGLIADGNERKQAMRSIVNALLVLAAKGQIDFVLLARQEGNIFGLGRPHVMHRVRLHQEARGEMVVGTLERRLLYTMVLWNDSQKEQTQPKDISLYDLGYNLFAEKGVKNPFDATLDIVRRDAYSSGVMTNKAGGDSSKVAAPDSENGSDLRTQVQVIQKVCDAIEEKYPALVDAIETNVKKGLQKRTEERRETEINKEQMFHIILRSVFRSIARL
jgi:hypothetical protein